LTYVRFADLEVVDQRVHAGVRPFTQAGVQLESFIYTSRGVYRPGETAQIAAMTRTADRSPAAGVPLQWKFRNARGNIYKEVSVKTSKQGFATFDLKLDSFAQTGKYTAELWAGEIKIAEQGFLVEEFVPERIGVKVTSEKPEYTDGTVPNFNID